MRTIDVVKNQSWVDLAVQCYGNQDAVSVLLEDNAGEELIDLAEPCALPTVTIREEHELKNVAVLRDLGSRTIATMK